MGRRWRQLAALAVITTALVAPAGGDFTNKCPEACRCMWVSGSRQAECTNIALTSVPLGLSSDVQVLDLSNTNIQELPKDAFRNVGLAHLQKLYIRHSNLRRLDKDAFRGLSLLIELDLSGNQITKLDTATFSDNEKLRRLLLSGNPIQALERYQFPPLQHIQRLDLSNCQLASVSPKAFNNLANLEKLSLNGNKLAVLESDVFQSLTKLKSLTLHDNPWRCDCHLRLFRDWLIEHNLYQEDTSCVEPERLVGKKWNMVDSEEFACRPQIYIPEPVVTAEVGENVTLRCQIAGNPAANTNWVLSGRILSNNTQIPFTNQVYIIHEEGNVNRWTNLTITSVSEQDAGQYLCVGINPGGVVEHNVTLVFHAPVVPGDSRPQDAVLARPLLVGLIVGAACLVLLVLLICCCCCRRSSNRAGKPASKQNGGPAGAPESVMVINPVEKPARMGQYEQLPQTDVEMERVRTPAGLSEPCTSVMCNPTAPAAGAGAGAGATRRHSLPDSPLVLDDPRRDYPDLLNLTGPGRAGQSSPAGSSASTQPDQSRLGPALLAADPRRAGPARGPRPGYVTLPRRPRTPSWGSSPARPITVDPVYDNLGPRTTVDGSSRLSLTSRGGESPAPDRLPAYYVPVETTSPPDPGIFSTLPRNGRAPLSIPSVTPGRPRSVSTDLIEPLREVPEEAEEVPPASAPPLVNGNSTARKQPPKPPPKPKKITPPVLPKPQLNGTDVIAFQDEGEDGTEV